MSHPIFRTLSLERLRLSAERGGSGLKRSLTAFDLTMLGIGVIIGAGIFSTIGTAAAGNLADGRPGAGPALIISFLLTAIACGFTSYGLSGIQAGAAIIFFAFIGFDALSTTALEGRDPGRDMPRGILASLAICAFICSSGLRSGLLRLRLPEEPSRLEGDRGAGRMSRGCGS